MRKEIQLLVSAFVLFLFTAFCFSASPALAQTGKINGQVVSAENGEPIPGGPYDVVIASLALHAIIGHKTDAPEAESRYELLFQGIGGSLSPGGHLFVADHTGTLGLYRQLKAMERAGFTDVDCAWRQDEFFVAGGRM